MGGGKKNSLNLVQLTKLVTKITNNKTKLKQNKCNLKEPTNETAKSKKDINNKSLGWLNFFMIRKMNTPEKKRRTKSTK